MANPENSTDVVVFQNNSKREQYNFHNNLVCLVKALEGSYTLVDLRNESCIGGKITKVDGFMNIEMEEAVYLNARGTEHYFPQFFVRHRNIRYIHIPKEFQSIDLIYKQLNGMSKFKQKGKQKQTFKQMRAQRYHKETVESLQK